jgi:hypothetical protein
MNAIAFTREERPLGRVSRDGDAPRLSWFETALKKRLLTMRLDTSRS